MRACKLERRSLCEPKVRTRRRDQAEAGKSENQRCGGDRSKCDPGSAHARAVCQGTIALRAAQHGLQRLPPCKSGCLRGRFPSARCRATESPCGQMIRGEGESPLAMEGPRTGGVAGG